MAPPRRVLVIRHSEIDQPGFFGKVMEQAGIVWQPCDPWQGEPFPPLEGYDAVLAMGGPQQTDEERLHPWLRPEKALLREAVEGGIPVLGVCLGCQLLADAHGGTVAPLPEAEVGIIDFALTEAGRADPLFAGMPSAPLTMQWHLNAVTALPRRAVLLASSPVCAIQAYRLAPRAYGVQFHMEVDAGLVQATEAFPEYIAALESLQGEGAFARMVADAAAKEETLRANGSRLFENFVGLMHAEDRRPAA
ncbi:MAG: type 1 glutamine amidotransferase [Rhodospirillaceae bacterium]|nr:type 1 glutamine amidotransferase [Rhodospirillaceae bacterium]